jgi:hypothetical protein
MDSDAEKQFEPVCRFGPGGDFVSIWPESSEFQLPSQSRLLKVLACLNEIISGLLGSEFNQSSTATAKTQSTPAVRFGQSRKPQDVLKGPAIPRKAQPMLFPDDSRVGLRAVHKPKHRIRAHRRTAKKRPRIDPGEQGLLFAADLKIARTA